MSRAECEAACRARPGCNGFGRGVTGYALNYCYLRAFSNGVPPTVPSQGLERGPCLTLGDWLEYDASAGDDSGSCSGGYTKSCTGDEHCRQEAMPADSCMSESVTWNDIKCCELTGRCYDDGREEASLRTSATFDADACGEDAGMEVVELLQMDTDASLICPSEAPVCSNYANNVRSGTCSHGGGHAPPPPQPAGWQAVSCAMLNEVIQDGNCDLSLRDCVDDDAGRATVTGGHSSTSGCGGYDGCAEAWTVTGTEAGGRLADGMFLRYKLTLTGAGGCYKIMNRASYQTEDNAHANVIGAHFSTPNGDTTATYYTTGVLPYYDGVSTRFRPYGCGPITYQCLEWYGDDCDCADNWWAFCDNYNTGEHTTVTVHWQQRDGFTGKLGLQAESGVCGSSRATYKWSEVEVYVAPGTGQWSYHLNYDCKDGDGASLEDLGQYAATPRVHLPEAGGRHGLLLDPNAGRVQEALPGHTVLRPDRARRCQHRLRQPVLPAHLGPDGRREQLRLLQRNLELVPHRAVDGAHRPRLQRRQPRRRQSRPGVPGVPDARGVQGALHSDAGLQPDRARHGQRRDRLLAGDEPDPV